MFSFPTHPFSARCRRWLVGLLLFSLVSPSMVSADIFEWEWVDPSDHSQGKQQSTTVVPDGAGLVPGSGLNAANKNLTQAYLTNYDLANASFYYATLTSADLRGSNLTSADLTNADLSGSYLTVANFYNATLTHADLSDANLTDASFWNATLTDAVLSGANLTHANFYNATLTDADFTGTEVRQAIFRSITDSGFTAAQLYSTASYQSGNLIGISLRENDLTSWDFAGKNFTNANFQNAILTDADLSGSNLTNAYFYKTILTDANLSNSNLDDSSFRDAILTDADLSNSNLSDASFWNATLADADLSGSNLIDAALRDAILSNTDFTGAEVRGADFYSTTDSGFTVAQFYSTASYQAGDLTGIYLSENDLTGWSFAGKDLTRVRFSSTILTGADLSGSNLTDARFSNGVLTDTDFTGAEIRGAHFFSTTDSGFTADQLYSTASYQSGDLTRIRLNGNNLTGWSFAGKNLTRTYFHSSILNNTDFTGADARSAQALDLSTAITHNFIHPDGHVEGLVITAGEEMRLWDFNLAMPVPILIQNAMSIDPTGTLRAVFEDDDWGSTLTFDAGIGVSLGGTLELLVDSREGSNVSSMVGVTFDLFDWTGVTPTGMFTQITTDDGLVWDTSDLYSTGEVTLLSAPSILFADFDDNGVVDEADLDAWRAAFGSTTDLDADGNGDGVIDAADYTVWRDNFVAPPSGDYNGDGTVDDADLLVWRAAFGSTTDLAADGNGNGVIDAADYTVWRDHYVAASVAVPEPTGLLLVLLGMTSCGWYGRRR